MTARLSRMRASIDRAWSSKPSARATGAAARASAPGVRDPHLGEACGGSAPASAPTRTAPRRSSAGCGSSRRCSRRTRSPDVAPTNTQPARVIARRQRLRARRRPAAGARARTPRRASSACVGVARPRPARRPRRCRAPADAPPRARRAASATSRRATTSVPGPCSAWASRSSASGPVSTPRVGDHAAGRSGRRSRRSRPGRTPGAWPPARTGCRGRRSRRPAATDLGAVGERRDRLRAAHPVDARSRRRAGTRRARPGRSRRRRPAARTPTISGDAGRRARSRRPSRPCSGTARGRPGRTRRRARPGASRSVTTVARSELDLASGRRERCLGDRRHVVDRELEPGADRRVEPRAAAASSSGSATRSGAGSAPPVSNWRVYVARPPSSPLARTPAMISATAARTDSGAGTSARSSAGQRRRVAGVRERRVAHTASRRSSSASIAARLQLVGDRVGDQPRRAARDLLADHEPVLAQRRPGRGQVDDPLRQAGQRRQLDRALDLDDLRLAAGVEEVARRDPRVLGRDPDHPEPPQRLGRAVLAGDRREHHRAAAVAEVDELVDLALGLLHQHVLAGDPDDRRRPPRRRSARPTAASSRSRPRRTAACGRSRGPRACRGRAGRAGRACRSNSAPRGTAIRRLVHCRRSSPVSAMCSRSTLSANPTAGSGRPKPAEQLVVAPAAADRHAVRGVVDLEHRAGVVAEAPHQPEVEDDPLGDLGREQRVHGAHAR